MSNRDKGAAGLLDQPAKDAFDQFLSHVTTSLQANHALQLEQKRAECEELENRLQAAEERTRKADEALNCGRIEWGDSKQRYEVATLQLQLQFAQIQTELRTRTEEYEKLKSHALSEHQRYEEHSTALVKELKSKLEENNTLKSRVETLEAEVAELHTTLKVIHSDLSLAQQEKAVSQENEDRYKRALENLRNTVERKEIEVTEIRSTNEDLNRKAQRFCNERDCLRQQFERFKKEAAETVQALSVRLHDSENQLNAHSMTNQQLNELLGHMQEDKRCLSNRSRANEAEMATTLNRMKVVETECQERLKEITSLQDVNKNLVEERATLVTELSRLQENLLRAVAESSQYQRKADRLECEKHDIILEMSQHASEMDTQRQKLSDYQDQVSELHSELAVARREKEQLSHEQQSTVETIKLLEDKLGGKGKEVERTIQLLEDETERSSKAMEATRAAQREAANRTVELSNKNAKLSAETTQLRQALEATQANADMLRTALRAKEEELAKIYLSLELIKKEYTVLQEEHDQLRKSYTELESQLEVISITHSEQVMRMKTEMENMHRIHQQQLENAMASHNREIEEQAAIASDTMKQVQTKSEADFAALKKSYQQQMEEIANHSKKQGNDAKNRMIALAQAMESLQKELQQEEVRNSSLEKQVAMLQHLKEHQASEALSNLKEQTQAMERQAAKEKSKFLTEQTEVRHELQLAQDEILKTKHLLEETTKLLSLQREENRANEIKLKKSGDEIVQLETRLERSELDMDALRRQNRECNRQLETMHRAHETEVQRLIKRNQVLNEAVTRMTGRHVGGGDVFQPETSCEVANENRSDGTSADHEITDVAAQQAESVPQLLLLTVVPADGVLENTVGSPSRMEETCRRVQHALNLRAQKVSKPECISPANVTKANLEEISGVRDKDSLTEVDLAEPRKDATFARRFRSTVMQSGLDSQNSFSAQNLIEVRNQWSAPDRFQSTLGEDRPVSTQKQGTNSKKLRKTSTINTKSRKTQRSLSACDLNPAAHQTDLQLSTPMKPAQNVS